MINNPKNIVSLVKAETGTGKTIALPILLAAMANRIGNTHSNTKSIDDKNLIRVDGAIARGRMIISTQPLRTTVKDNQKYGSELMGGYKELRDNFAVGEVIKYNFNLSYSGVPLNIKIKFNEKDAIVQKNYFGYLDCYQIK